MFIWGRNNHHLFRNNHKQTYSLPQKTAIKRPVEKCAAGYDYLLLLAQQQIIVHYQSAYYQIKQAAVIDIATYDNVIVFIHTNGTAWITDFTPERILNSEFNPTCIKINDNLKKVYMGHGDIFLLSEHNLYHLRRNDWYQTKTYSDPVQIQLPASTRISQIAPGANYNYFLTQDGTLMCSSKKTPHEVFNCCLSKKFISISASDYFAGISTNGAIYIWGTCLGVNYTQPTEFSKITVKFISVSVNCQNGFAVSEQGQVWVWGRNANGQLGVSDYEQRSKPFPLITMDGLQIRAIYQGENYTVCLTCLSSAAKQKLNSKTYQSACFVDSAIESKENSMQFKQVPFIERQKFETFEAQKPSKEINLRENKILKQIDQKLNKKRLNTKTEKVIRTPKKNAQVSKSPLSNRSLNKSSNKKQGLQKIKRTQVSPNNKTINNRAQELQIENEHLRKQLEVKDVIIDDITNKIKLLQDAIDEHEKNLTARDHLMDQYQQREKQYQIHIDQLQKSIQALIKGKNLSLENTKQVQKDHYLQLYNNLRFDYSKQKQYYLHKIQNYEIQIKQQRQIFNRKLKELELKQKDYRARPDRQNEEKQVHEVGPSAELKNEGSRMVEMVINRIEQNKNRISRSANKLIQMLEH